MYMYIVHYFMNLIKILQQFHARKLEVNNFFT